MRGFGYMLSGHSALSLRTPTEAQVISSSVAGCWSWILLSFALAFIKGTKHQVPRKQHMHFPYPCGTLGEGGVRALLRTEAGEGMNLGSFSCHKTNSGIPSLWCILRHWQWALEIHWPWTGFVPLAYSWENWKIYSCLILHRILLIVTLLFLVTDAHFTPR
jgi:hypothetical protein